MWRKVLVERTEERKKFRIYRIRSFLSTIEIFLFVWNIRQVELRDRKKAEDLCKIYVGFRTRSRFSSGRVFSSTSFRKKIFKIKKKTRVFGKQEKFIDEQFVLLKRRSEKKNKKNEFVCSSEKLFDFGFFSMRRKIIFSFSF